tara:strand:+ start:983 stop:2521 length:1539 start_codon:yes stop_codon:yes gene_type:complete
MADSVKQILERYAKAEATKQLWSTTFEECYEYALPQRESFYQESQGANRHDKIFDETAVVGVQEFASRLQAGIVPNFARWADLVGGQEVPEEERLDVNKALDDVTEYVFEVLQNSNFNQEVHESFLDLAVGTGCLLVEEGDAINPVNFTAIPLPHICLDTGPQDDIDTIYRKRLVRCKDLMVAYPDADLSSQMKQSMIDNPDKKINIIETVYRDYSVLPDEKYHYCVVIKEEKRKIVHREMNGNGSNPYICFRWGKCAGEVYGRGPLMNAMAAIKTTNLTVEMILENAQMAISGIYQLEDDGIVNTDTIQLLPGTVIPKAPGSSGLQPIQNAGDFRISDIILSDMRNNIKRALYNDMLGDPNRTPASATEIAERMADLSRRIGSAFGRLQAELVTPILRRVIHILKKQGRIEVPQINGREIKVVSISPLAQAQMQTDIASVDRFLELVMARFGPQMLPMLVKGDEVAKFLAKKFSVPEDLLMTDADRQQVLQQAQQMGAIPNDEATTENTGT